jgi:hypothetical protein
MKGEICAMKNTQTMMCKFIFFASVIVSNKHKLHPIIRVIYCVHIEHCTHITQIDEFVVFLITAISVSLQHHTIHGTDEHLCKSILEMFAKQDGIVPQQHRV